MGIEKYLDRAFKIRKKNPKKDPQISLAATSLSTINI
jgi:hypothetical protein